MHPAPTLDDSDTRGSSSIALSLEAPDGYRLAADLVAPAEPPRAAVLIAPAMGVPRRYYAAFARFLASRGVASLALDYRGIGGSRATPLRALRATLTDWAELDLTAGADALARRFPHVPLRFVGHSVGGQLMGFVPDAPFDAAIFVGSQSGYWKHWDGAARAGMAVMWHAAIPSLVGALGYLPGRALGGGEDVPAGVARQWARWGRDPDYLGVSARELDGAWFGRWNGRLRSYAIADDGYAPERSVRALAAMYPRADREVRVVRPRDVGASRIGHFGFFRASFEPTLWTEAADFLVEPAPR